MASSEQQCRHRFHHYIGVSKSFQFLRVRIRAHTILLSSQGTTVDEIAQIYQAHRNSVSSWIDKWEVFGAEGLYDQPRSGSPPKLNEKEQEVAKDLIKAYPNAPKRV